MGTLEEKEAIAMLSLPIREVYLVEKSDGVHVIVYVDERQWSAELADELGGAGSPLQNNLLQWIKAKYPHLKIVAIKIVIGSMVVGTVALAPTLDTAVEAAGASILQSVPMEIVVNGKKLVQKDPPYVIANRTLIPIRDIAEALGATVLWDGVKRTVEVRLGDRHIVLPLDSKTVYVNGKAVQSELHTQILRERTYVPLRLVSEQLGATVQWQQATQTVTIQRNEAVQAFLVDEIHAYTVVDYVGDPTALRALQSSGARITSMSTFAHQVQADGTVTAPFGVNVDALEYAKSIGLPNHMLIYNMHGGSFSAAVAHQVLSDAQAQEKLIDEILFYVAHYGYDGVEIDFEGIGSADRAYFTAFLQALKDKLTPLHLPLIVAVPAKTWDDPKNSWSGGYDFAEIGSIADRVMVMAYDEHWSGGPAGPVSSLPWYEKVAAYVAKTIPKDKVYMGIPLYGYDWPTTGKARALLPVGIEKIIAQYGGTAVYDAKSATPKYEYTDAKGIAHVIWFEDNASIAKKIEVVQRHGFKGVGLWRLGYEKQELWQVLQPRQGKDRA